MGFCRCAIEESGIPLCLTFACSVTPNIFLSRWTQLYSWAWPHEETVLDKIELCWPSMSLGLQVLSLTICCCGAEAQQRAEQKLLSWQAAKMAQEARSLYPGSETPRALPDFPMKCSSCYFTGQGLPFLISVHLVLVLCECGLTRLFCKAQWGKYIEPAGSIFGSHLLLLGIYSSGCEEWNRIVTASPIP